MATRNEIEQIKDRLNIVDVVGRYVTLKKAGTNLRALCPFHNEKTPSFMVNPELNIFKCFGCGESGDVFAFVQKIEGLEFGEALEQLAGQAGVALTNDIKAPSTGKIKERELFTDLNSFVAGLYEYLLWQSPVGEPARAYLRERGIGEAIAKQFRLGYVPDRWDTVVKTLAEKGYTLSTAEKLGLVIRSDRQDGYYDRFRDRLMFPIFDPQDKVVGFSGRTLKKEFEGGKYINSPDSDIYHKGQILYAYNFAKHQARLSEELILVEGNLDVIQLHQAGEQNVVAPLGTALTSEQM